MGTFEVWIFSSSSLDMLIFNNCRQKKVQRDEGKHVGKRKRKLICPVGCPVYAMLTVHKHFQIKATIYGM